MSDICGQFKDVAVVKLISWLRNNKKTGLLRLTHGQQRKEFRFRLGQPFAFRSNFAPEQLEYLLADKQIAEIALLRSLRSECRQKKQSFARELVARGYLEKAELKLWMQQSLHLAIDNASRWSVGSFNFRPLSLEQIGKPFLVPPKSESQETEAPKPETILAEESIFTEIREKLLSNEIELPPMPATLMKVRECLVNPDWDNQDLLKIIMSDQLLTTSILKVANSSLYGFSSRVSSLQHALVLMGMKTIWGIVTHQSLLGAYPNQKKQVEQVLEHGFLCALLAKQIALTCQLDEEDAFTCGLLHDIGKVVLYSQLPQNQYTQILHDRLIGRFHCQAGLLIAAKWNLPDVVLETIENHHLPEKATENRSMSEVIYIANCLANGQEPIEELLSEIDLSGLDLECLRDMKERFEP